MKNWRNDIYVERLVAILTVPAYMQQSDTRMSQPVVSFDFPKMGMLDTLTLTSDRNLEHVRVRILANHAFVLSDVHGAVIQARTALRTNRPIRDKHCVELTDLNIGCQNFDSVVTLQLEPCCNRFKRPAAIHVLTRVGMMLA